MLNAPPINEPVTRGTRALVYLPQLKKSVEILFGEGMEEEVFISQHLPYLILAQLFRNPMLAGTCEDDLSFNAYVAMLHTLGSIPEFLCRIGSHLSILQTITIPNAGNFLSGKNGLIDVLAQTIQLYF